MSYQALYRKFRPDHFGDVKGQEHIVTTLKNQIQSDHIGHAYLFCGTRGTGKTTVAKIFAKAVNCENPGENGPCGECAMCQSIMSGNSMNVVEMDAASNNKVDDIRQVIEEVQYSPPQGKYKVYIIDEVHMLTTNAFNALLKTLEEPPSYLIFILATTEVHKIPLTIMSRCQRYDFKRISVETISARLRELLDREGIEAEQRALDYIAKMADGALRDGLSLLEQCISFYYGETLTYENVLKVLGAVDNEVYAKFVDNLASCDAASILKQLEVVSAEGKDFGLFCNELIWYLRNLMLAKSTENPERFLDMSKENMEMLLEVAKKIEIETVFRYIRILSEVENQMKFSSQKRVLFEVACIKLCRPEMEVDQESVLQRIHVLEEKMEQGVPVQMVQGEPQAPASQAPPKKKILPEAVSDDVKQVVANWQQVVNLVGTKNQAAASYLKSATLSVEEDGSLMVAFSSEVISGFFQEDERNMDDFMDAMEQIIQKKVRVVIRAFKTAEEFQAIPELRDSLGEFGVEVEIED